MNQSRLSSEMDTSAGLFEVMTTSTCLVSPVADALALEGAEAVAVAGSMAPAKSSYSSGVSSCF